MQVREGEATTALLMFVYSFLAMTSYNIIKPITRSKFIPASAPTTCRTCSSARASLIGVIMQGYTGVIAVVPRRWMIPVTQAGIAGAAGAVLVPVHNVGAGLGRGRRSTSSV